MIHYFIPIEASDDRMSVLLVAKSLSLFFFFTFYYFVYVCMEHVESREKLNFVCVCMEHVWRSEKKPVLPACGFEESNLIRSL